MTRRGHRKCALCRGWNWLAAYVPFLLQLIGATQTTSIDVNPWLTKKLATETLQALAERIPEISTCTATNAKTIQARIESAQATTHNLHRMLARRTNLAD